MRDAQHSWKPRLRLLLTNLVERQQEYREVANLASQVTADYHGRFLIELLQNAADQAIGYPDARVLILWAPGLLAVANQGAPFSEAGLTALTSIALSPKKADEAIGHKGLGFKSVFEVTDTPEVYSRVESLSASDPGDEFRWCLHNTPFKARNHLGNALKLCRYILGEDPRLAAGITRRYGEGWELHVEKALEESAPFKYPINLDERHFQQRLEDLELSPEEISQYTTLIALPLRPQVDVVVARVLAELLEPSGALITFLPHISHIELRAWSGPQQLKANMWRRDVATRPCGAGRFITRESHVQVVRAPRHRVLSKVNTPHRGSDPLAAMGAGDHQRSWWLVERSFGTMSEEQTAIQNVTATLPGDAWRNLHPVPIRVGLPHPDPQTLELPTDGRFVVGLPTQFETGSAFWIDSHFYSTISRTGINLDSPLNTLLFTQAKALVGVLLKELKADTRLTAVEGLPLARLAVVPACKTGNGPLGNWLKNESDLLHGPIVLAPDGKTFRRPAELLLPRKEDISMFLELEGDCTDPGLEAAGYCLAHPALHKSHHSLLKSLGAKLGTGPDQRPLFVVRRGETALVERWAEKLRHEGSQRWEAFLSWVCRSAKHQYLQPLRILPVGTKELVAPEVGVFLPLCVSPDRWSREPTLAEVPTAVRNLLPFLDESAVATRDTEGRLTPLVESLVGAPPNRLGGNFSSEEPNVEFPLLLRPTVEVLLTRAWPPAMAAALKKRDEAAAFRLFVVGLRWSGQIEAARIPPDLLKIPAADGTWRSAKELALGQGWMAGGPQHDLREATLAVLYPGRHQRTLSWSDFSEGAGVREEERTALSRQLVALGVGVQPRQRKFPSGSVLRLQPGSEPVLLGEYPIKGMEPQWDEYRLDLAAECVRRGWTGEVQVEPVWIDGMETRPSAQVLLNWLLAECSDYKHTVSVQVRGTYWQRMDWPSWWVHVIRMYGLDRVPTATESWSRGRALPASKVCSLDDKQQQSGSLRLLPHLPLGTNLGLPRALGVVEFEKADATWIISRMVDVHTELKEGRLQISGGVEVLVLTLYERLDHLCKTGQTLYGLRNATVPVWRGHSLDSMCLADEPILYIEDDPYRTRYIPDYEQRAHLRVRRGGEFPHLMKALVELVGAHGVVLTRDAHIHIPFTSEEVLAQPLLSWLEDRCGRSDLRLLLATVLVYGRPGRGEIQPYHRDAWARLIGAVVKFGRFEDESWSFYDQPTLTLLVAKELEDEPMDLLAETWQVLGEPWQEVWEVFANRLSQGDGRLQRYLRDKRIGATEYEKVEQAFDLQPAVAGEPSTSSPHTGRLMSYAWTSRKGHHYGVTRWSCCGQYENHPLCTRTAGRFHPGKLYAGGSRSGGGNGSDSWSCCGRFPTEPGCTDDGVEE